MVWLFHRHKIYCVILSFIFLFSACDENNGNDETDEGEVIVAECPGIPTSLLKAVDGFPISLSPEEEDELTTTGELRLRLIYRPSINIEKFKEADTPSFGTSNNFIYGLTYGYGKFVAVGQSGKLATSPDGNTWTQQTSSFGADAIFDICWGEADGKFVACGTSGKLAYSSNGTSWTQDTYPWPSGTTVQGVCYGGGKYIACSNEKIAYSNDGISWTLASSPGFGTGPLCYELMWDSVNSRYWASGSYAKLAYSTDGDSWTHIGGTSLFGDESTSFYALCMGKGIHLAAGGVGGGNPARIYYSTNNWSSATKVELSGVYWIYGLCYTNGYFLCVGTKTTTYNSYCAYSRDGITWTEVDVSSIFGSANYPYQLFHAAQRAVMVGSNNNIAFCFI